ncbi:hypothetical protein EYF80_044843 [Liparis tanakae]|uniref:Uncharacterized protein n=1 Tax=Liparis tanakae TaxID=230148 RepID=A0A4Z2FVB2_9TELE|nr:hypothetical protein EYF80_044843 [Liparis tanakae]
MPSVSLKTTDSRGKDWEDNQGKNITAKQDVFFQLDGMRKRSPGSLLVLLADVSELMHTRLGLRMYRDDNEIRPPFIIKGRLQLKDGAHSDVQSPRGSGTFDHRRREIATPIPSNKTARRTRASSRSKSGAWMKDAQRGVRSKTRSSQPVRVEEAQEDASESGERRRQLFEKESEEKLGEREVKKTMSQNSEANKRKLQALQTPHPECLQMKAESSLWA